MAPLGTIVGYGITASVQFFGSSWKESFKYQAYGQVVLAFIILCVPSKYVNIDEVHTARIDELKSKFKKDDDNNLNILSESGAEKSKFSQSANIFTRSRTIDYKRKESKI